MDLVAVNMLHCQKFLFVDRHAGRPALQLLARKGRLLSLEKNIRNLIGAYKICVYSEIVR
jgi:hypothetical protein